MVNSDFRVWKIKTLLAHLARKKSFVALVLFRREKKNQLDILDVKETFINPQFLMR